MSIVRQILKFKVNLNLSTREIASSINRSKSTVASILKRKEQTGLTFQEILALGTTSLINYDRTTYEAYFPEWASPEKLDSRLGHFSQ